SRLVEQPLLLRLERYGYGPAFLSQCERHRMLEVEHDANGVLIELTRPHTAEDTRPRKDMHGTGDEGRERKGDVDGSRRGRARGEGVRGGRGRGGQMEDQGRARA